MNAETRRWLGWFSFRYANVMQMSGRIIRVFLLLLLLLESILPELFRRSRVVKDSWGCSADSGRGGILWRFLTDSGALNSIPDGTKFFRVIWQTLLGFYSWNSSGFSAILKDSFGITRPHCWGFFGGGRGEGRGILKDSSERPSIGTDSLGMSQLFCVGHVTWVNVVTSRPANTAARVTSRDGPAVQ